MSIILGILLVLSFVLYSVALWGTGYFQLRDLTEQEKSSGKSGNERVYMIFLVITLVSLMVYFGMNMYISLESAEAPPLPPKLSSLPPRM